MFSLWPKKAREIVVRLGLKRIDWTCGLVTEGGCCRQEPDSDVVVRAGSQIVDVPDDSDETYSGDNHNGQHGGSSAAAFALRYFKFYLTCRGGGRSIGGLPDFRLL